MAWNLASVESKVSMSLDVGDGPLSGTLIVDGDVYSVTGGWAASGSGNDRKASAFYLAGQEASGPTSFVAAAGSMAGSGEWPQSVQIAGARCSSGDGIVHPFVDQLLPKMSTDPTAIAQAYSESGCILMIDTSLIPPACTAGFISGAAMSTADCQKVCSGIEPTTVTIPKKAPNKPVCVVFLGPPDHYINPPLEEAHYQIVKILYDAGGYQRNSAWQGLVLEYSNDASKHPTQVIVFNERPEPFAHASIIIRPQ